MSWTDKKSIEQIKKFRDTFNIETFIETGTFRGFNAFHHSYNFKHVYSCELVDEYYKLSKTALDWYKLKNVNLFKIDSPKFLNIIKQLFTEDIIFIYLDAHFYDPSLPKEDRWVVLKELDALKNTKNCVIAIHDFDCNGLGHINYDGQTLNFDFVKERLLKVNENFNFYYNTKEWCDITTKDDILNNKLEGIELNNYVSDTLDFVWSQERLTYRGILYCSPKPIDLNKFELVSAL